MIALESEIVASRYDAKARTNHYTIARGNRRWTVAVHDDALKAHGGNKQARRKHLENALEVAMRGKADGEE